MDLIEEGEDGPTLSSVAIRALEYYLFDEELSREKYWRNLCEEEEEERHV